MKIATKKFMSIQKGINGRYNFYLPGFFIVLLFFIIADLGCQKDAALSDAPPDATGYQEIDLVADTTCNSAIIDENLKNAWGIAIGPTGAFWVVANQTGLSTIYDRNGAELLAPVTIPFNGVPNGGSPTGVIVNTTTDFVIPANQQASKFIFVAEDGTVTAWSSGSSASTVADRSSDEAVYKGVAMANDGGQNFLYAANFKGGSIDVFDKSFNEVTTKPFVDPTIPAGFAPFNIQNIGGMLYVTYAKQLGPDNEDDERGLGNGYVDIFKPDGSFVKRFASNGTLNSPWGMALAPDGFGLGQNMILIGNFGDGKINIYDSNGSYQGQLKDGSTVIAIDGLWEIIFPKNNIPAGDQNQLFFAAGPDDERHGLFGYIKMR
ncbi:TIGR03118 family protein [Solitalea canadensis]|uniref:TIGR03118 family protein n=1 Tax=Solitalea canadensis (strain ATCC 29591 / DSM 3403 / JCM 21819 / LMG 8368 / NBRC 15130 / NCIMB 12057 / USAM 9D) TaxID=929556 RepID=H8KQ92_SOLCM|nr:TIGR03118 family protein [Solitalea canadensis]AFD06387.1 TIGR03118 family protein [Solitalea canadensis DSM 3403]